MFFILGGSSEVMLAMNFLLIWHHMRGSCRGSELVLMKGPLQHVF